MQVQFNKYNVLIKKLSQSYPATLTLSSLFLQGSSALSIPDIAGVCR